MALAAIGPSTRVTGLGRSDRWGRYHANSQRFNFFWSHSECPTSKTFQRKNYENDQPPSMPFMCLISSLDCLPVVGASTPGSVGCSPCRKATGLRRKSVTLIF